MYTIIISIFSIIVFGQLWYIIRLRKAIEYAVKTLLKYEAALMADNILVEQMKKGMKNGSEKD